MDSILGSFDTGWVGTIGTYVLYGGIFLIICLALTAVIVLFVARAKEKKVVLLDMVTKKLYNYGASEKRMNSGKKHLYIKQLKKFLPQIQQEDYFIQGKKDAIILIRDNNGLIHTARLPKYEEMIAWYKNVYGTDITVGNDSFLEEQRALTTIYLIPNPAENLEWLADQVIQSNKEFITAWWKSPAAIWIGTIALCSFTFIITLFVAKKL